MADSSSLEVYVGPTLSYSPAQISSLLLALHFAFEFILCTLMYGVGYLYQNDLRSARKCRR